MNLTTNRARVAATAFALLTPIALLAGCGKEGSVTGGSSDSSPSSSPTSGPSTPTKAPTTAPADPRVLETSDLSRGAAPKIGWLDGTAFHTPDGRTLQLDRAYAQVVAFDDGWLASFYDDNGDARAVRLGAAGKRLGAGFPSGQGLATSSDGEKVLYVDAGRLVVHDNGSAATTVLRSGVGQETEPIGYADATAFYNVMGEDGAKDARWFRDGQENDPSPTGHYAYSGLAHDRTVSAVTKVSDDGSCSEITAAHGNRIGETCDFTLGDFSPNGKNLLAHPAYRDGFADGELAVVTRNGGTPVVHFLQSGERDAAIVNSRWEDDLHLLVITFTPSDTSAEGSWQIVRIGLDGSVENAVAPVQAEDLEGPFRFAD